VLDGEVTDVQPWRVLFNDGALLQFLHMWVAAFMVTGFTIAAVYAAGMLRGRSDWHHRLGFTIPFTFASIAALLQPLVGHVLGSRLAETQPAKLAAFELAVETEQPAPLRLGGLLIDGEVRYALDIPYLGSLIARNSFFREVPGFDQFPAADRPPANITHLAFQSMVGIGLMLMLGALIFWIARWRGHDLLVHRWFLSLVVVSGPLAVVALEAGWVATEVGRQPWVVYGFLRTADAAGSNPALWLLLAATVVVYSALTVAAVVVLRSMARRWRRGEEDLPSPYGPQLPAGAGVRERR
jgi:cytochrome bd ubiquinol oxidase subunit I